MSCLPNVHQKFISLWHKELRLQLLTHRYNIGEKGKRREQKNKTKKLSPALDTADNYSIIKASDKLTNQDCPIWATPPN